ncbi:MAG TPA: oligosaccharide flippase family protein [Candidatus Obscuribacterales bacterium]
MSKKTAQAWLGTFAVNSLILLCNIVTGVLTARLLLPEGRGILAVIVFWPEVASQIGLWHIDLSIAQRASQEDADVDRITITGIYLVAGLATITIFIAYFLLPYLLGTERSQWLPLARYYLIAFVPFNFLGLSLLELNRAKQQFTYYNLLRLSTYIIYLIGVLILWNLDQVSIINLIVLKWFSTFFTTLIRFLPSIHLLSLKPSFKEAQELLKIGSRFKVGSIFEQISSRMDQLVVNTFLTNQEIGLYAVALTYAQSGLSILTASFNVIIFPKLARLKEISQQKSLLSKGLRYNMIVTFMGSIPLIFGSFLLIPFLFGQDFNSAVIPAIGLCIVAIPMSIRQVIRASLNAMNQPYPNAVNSALVSAIFFILSGVLIYQFRLMGIVGSLFIANCIGVHRYLRYLNDQFHFDLKDWWGLNYETFSETRTLIKAFIKK